jgi:glycosyltransferase involved in cell wall biosynthesis
MSEKQLEIVFVVARGRLGPAAHKRVYDLIPLLGTRGYRCHVVSWDWELLWRVRTRIQAGSRPLASTMYALNAARVTPRLIRARNRLNRSRIVRLLRSAHAVVINQCTLDDDWRALLAAHARHVVYEFDDAVWLYDEAEVGKMFDLADVVVGGNAFLASYARARHDDVIVIPTGVRLDRYEAAGRIPRPSESPFTIGWVGSPSTTKYLELLVEPLGRLGAETPVALEVVGSGNASLPSFGNVEVRLHPALPYDPVRYVPRFDVGVMPLFDGEAERGKCGAKALEYMAAGVPAVCSAVGANTEIVEHGVSGFLVDDADGWVDVLRALAGDPSLRRRVGEAGRERVRQHYSADVVVGLWDECLRGRLGAGRQRSGAQPGVRATTGRGSG